MKVLKIMGIIVLVLAVCSMIVIAAPPEQTPPAEVEVDISAGFFCCSSVDFKYNRVTNGWEYDGKGNAGFDPVIDLADSNNYFKTYNEGYITIARYLKDLNEVQGYNFLTGISAVPPTLFKNDIKSITVKGIPEVEDILSSPPDEEPISSPKVEEVPLSSTTDTSTGTTSPEEVVIPMKGEVVELIVSEDCSEDILVNKCTIANSVIVYEKDETKIPFEIFVDGETHELFWNAKKNEWDYCAGEGCSKTAKTISDHVKLNGGEKIIIYPTVNEISNPGNAGDTRFYIDQEGIIYNCPEGTETCQVKSVELLNIIKNSPDFKESQKAAQKKAGRKVEETVQTERTLSPVEKSIQEVNCFYNPQKYDCKGVTPRTADAVYAELDAKALSLEPDFNKDREIVQTLEYQIKQFPPPGTEQTEKEIKQEIEIRKKYQIAIGNFKTLKKEMDEYRKAADSIRWKGSWLDTWKSGKVYDSIKNVQHISDAAGLLSRDLSRYQALSTLILPDATKAFIDATNFGPLNAWADLPGYASRELCEAAFIKNRKVPGQSASYVQTAAGTYQFVGAIHAEKSTDRVPILCQKRLLNKTKDVEEEFFCKSSFVCKEDGFCYKDKKAKTPEIGNFYKIVWGVTAPSDEKSTPYVDEDGKAVKFNLQLVGANNPWLYKKGRFADDSVIELINGARKTEMIIHFSEHDYTEVCIRFDERYRVKDYFGGDVPEICEPFVETNRGSVEFAQSDKTTSTSSTAEEVTLDTEW